MMGRKQAPLKRGRAPAGAALAIVLGWKRALGAESSLSIFPDDRRATFQSERAADASKR